MPVQIPGLENLSPAVKYVIAFAIIFVLLALFALVLRRLTGGRSALTSERGRARQPRLGIVDVYDLDRQRQLILLRRDNVEHLLLVGGPNDVVVETNIVRVPGARLTPVAPDAGEVSTEAMRPVVDALARPSEPTIAARLGPSDTVSAGPNGSGPSVREPILKPTVVHAGPAVPQPEPAPRPSVQPPPPRPAAPDRGPPSETIRVGESAVRRPPPPPRPEPVRPAPPPPPPAAEVRVRAPEPPPRAPDPAPRPVEPTVRVSEPAVRVAEPPPRPARPASPPPAPSEPAPVRPAPRPAPPPASPAPPPPAAAPAAPAAPAATKSDPFSIEDIEAEFARLLGRPLDKKE